MLISNHLWGTAKTKTGMFLVLIMFLAGCSLRVVSPYDAYTDDLIMQLSTEISTFFENMKRLNQKPECEYENYRNFYVRSNVIIDVLILRNSTRPENNVTIDMLKLFKRDIMNVEKYHKNKECEIVEPAGKRFLEVVHENFNIALESILELEERKRRKRIY